MSTEPDTASFVDWDHRPAVIGVGGAYAMLKPNSSWVRVSAADVANSANVLHEHIWRKKFQEKFGELDPPLELANTQSDVPWHWEDDQA